MPFEFPEEDLRRMHIVRICGRDRDGEVVPDIWVDVLRIDKMRINTQNSIDFGIVAVSNRAQRVTLVLKWNDENGEQAEFDTRETVTVKVCAPDEENPEDPDEYVPVEAIKRLHMRLGSVVNNRHFFDSLVVDKVRPEEYVAIRRICHYDTNFDEEAEEAFLNGDTTYYINMNEYVMNAETKDETDHVEHEVVMRGNLMATPHWAGAPARKDHKTTFRFKNDFLIDGSDEANAAPGGEINPPWRLDAFQNIINVNLGARAVEFEEGEYIQFDNVPPNTKKFTMCAWFRVPSSVLRAEKAAYDAWSNDTTGTVEYHPLLGRVPLCVFGAAPVRKMSDFEQVTVGISPSVQKWRWVEFCSPDGEGGFRCDEVVGWVPYEDLNPGVPLEAPQFFFTGATQDAEAAAIDPCYIAVDCRGDYPTIGVNLNLVRTATPSISDHVLFTVNLPSHIDQWGFLGSSLCCNGPTHYLRPIEGGGGFRLCLTPLQNAYSMEAGPGGNSDRIQLTATPERFMTRRADSSFGSRSDTATGNSFAGQEVEGDHWHCLILSFDGTNGSQTRGMLLSLGDPGDPSAQFGQMGSRTSKAARMFMALDDENITRRQMSGLHPTGYRDANAVLTENAYYIGSDIQYQGSTTDDDCVGNMVTTITNGATATYNFNGADIPIGDGAFGIPTNKSFASRGRRVEMANFQWFNDVVMDTAKNRNIFITDKGKPASMKLAEKFFNKTPEIRLRKLSDWQHAKNTGSLVTDPNETGTVVGEIEKYTPGPSLYGPQGEES